MKNLKTQITILIILFVFPSISLSQTFKCEFISEKFKGGKSNEGSCSGDPEIIFSSRGYTHPRNQHCKLEDNHRFNDYLNFIVDMDKKMVSYSFRSGLTEFGLDDMVLYEKRKGNTNEIQVREKYRNLMEYDSRNTISSVQEFTQLENNVSGNNINFLITFGSKTKGWSDDINTLFIPVNGNSILSFYNLVSDPDRNSWVKLKFGKCVNTSK